MPSSGKAAAMLGNVEPLISMTTSLVRSNHPAISREGSICIQLTLEAYVQALSPGSSSAQEPFTMHSEGARDHARKLQQPHA